MADIFDNEEIDKDTVEEEELDQLFPENYNLLTEKAVSLKKSYINKLHGTKSLKLAVSVSDGSIEVYELNNSSLDQVCRLSGHRGVVGGVVFSPREDHLLYSAGQHGVVKLWDTRASGSCVQEYKGIICCLCQILHNRDVMDMKFRLRIGYRYRNDYYTGYGYGYGY
ncbi:unnamed protein product [Plutella xylostella]|uniref:(diamondback moth) hypothetical protein n=1 Tax=Plutella xylostella TaxID=51655 RepID=A0A8S4GAW1_PLUXY|nr:unnamed protein product [Plutella xylostella]